MANPFTINGGTVLAMTGKNCVAIACDLRLGMQALTVSNDFPKITSYGSVYLGLAGLATDVLTVPALMRYKAKLYKLREERDISPKTFANLVSTTFYEHRFGPYLLGGTVVAGVENDGTPLIAGFDSIGCIDYGEGKFVIGGTASDQLYGMCEALYEENLGPDELFETVSQALLSAMDRDALSGWGAHVYIIEQGGKVTKRLLKSRQD